MSNTNNVTMSPVVPGSNKGLVDLRNDLLNTMGEAAAMVELSMSDYVMGLNLAFAFDWFDIKHADLGKSPEGKLVRTEKTALFDALKARKHSNPSVFWTRLCDKARDTRYPEEAEARIAAAAAAAAAATTEGEGESKGASRNRTPLVRNGEEITALVKFNEGLDLEGEFAQLKEVTALLKQALGLIYSAKVTN
jgi:hypothetical protein